MKYYSVSYDLNRPGQDYESLYAVLKSFSSWARPTKSQWILKTTLSSREIFQRLSQHIDSNDRVFISAIDLTDTWWIVSQDVAAWINQQSGLTV